MIRTLLFATISAFLLTLNSAASDYVFSPGKGITFSWKVNDEIGTYTSKGSRIHGTVTTVDADSHQAIISLGSWSTVKNVTYYAYAPYATKYVEQGHPITALPISYSSQTQSENNSLSHLHACDFMMDKYTTSESTAEISLRHLGSILRIEWPVPTTESLASLSLTTEEETFITEATMNLPEQSVIPVTKSNTITLSLGSIALSETEPLIAYLMMLPTNLEGKVIVATVTTTEGKSFTTRLNGVNIEAAHTYPITIGQADTKPLTRSLSSSLAAPSVTTTDFPIDEENEFTIHIIKGDVNDDGIVDEQDALNLRRHYANGTTSTLDPRVCDVNEDGVIDLLDVVLLSQPSSK